MDRDAAPAATRAAAYWTGRDFESDEWRRRFRRALMARARSPREDGRTLVLPYWRSEFNDWLLYEGTLGPAGAVCTERDGEFCWFEADASGVQNEGICMVALFRIPTREFTKRQLDEIVPCCGEYYPLARCRQGCTYGPFGKRGYIRACEWRYDEYYDDKGKEE